jgi:glutamate carboxypeptidase
MHLKTALAIALSAAACVPLAHAATDTALLRAAQQAQPAVVSTLKELVQIESGSANVAGLQRMADYTEKRLQALGARTERLPVSSGPGGTMVKGSFSGSGTARILLIAHMDTVYPEGTLATQPIKEEGNRLYGPGIADDKGGIAVILHTLQILKDAGWRDYAQLTVLFNPDEEIGSIGSGETIAAVADQHDVVLSCEPTAAKSVAKQEALLLGASGTATATLEVKGRSAHAGAAPELGRNALIELSYQLLQTRDVAKGVPGAQLNWTTAKAGEVRNQIPERAVAGGDVRTTQPDAAQRLQAALQEKVKSGHLVPDTETRVQVEVGRPPFIAGERGRALAEHAKGIYAELDGRALALVPMTGGATDAAFAGRSGKAAVVESFGLAGFGYHARDEYVELDSIVPRLYLMGRLLQDIGAGKAGVPAAR